MMILILLLNSLYASPVLNLKDVLELTKDNSPTLKGVNEKKEQSKAQKVINRAPIFPTLSWNLSGATQKDALYTGSPKFDGNSYNQYATDLKLSQTLYTRGLFSSVSESETEKKIQEINRELEEKNLTLQVIEVFYRFILNQKLLENLQKTEQIIQKSLETTNKRYALGRGQLLDVLQVKTQLALIKPQIDKAENQLSIASVELSKLIGDSIGSTYSIRGQLKILYLKDIKKLIDLNNYHLPEYELNNLQIEKLSYSKDVAFGKEYPTVKLVGDYYYNNYKKAELFSDYSNSWSIALQLTLPLFSGFSSYGQSELYSAKERELRMDRKNLEQNLMFKQTSALKNLESAEASLESAETAAKISEEAQLEATRIYKLSMIDFLQFLSVQQAALQAKSSLEQLKYESVVAYSKYFASSGQPLEILLNLLSEGEKSK